MSGGSTPTAWRMHEVPGVTEVRPGTYVYNDRTTAEIGACGWEDCALTVLATVVSRAVPGQAVIDAGTKALGREPMRGAAGEGFGVVMDRPDVVVRACRRSTASSTCASRTGIRRSATRCASSRTTSCIVVHLNDVIYGVRDSIVETSWTVAARGPSGRGSRG